MAPHELDLHTSHKDNVKFAGKDGAVGTMIAWNIADYINLNETERLIKDSTILAVGAGAARPELAFAAELAIPNTNITLVDRDYDTWSETHLEQKNPGVKIVNSGLFTFLSQTQQKYSFILAFGLEYVLRRKAINTFISLLPNASQQNTIVIAGPLNEDAHDTWVSQGFQSIERSEDSWSTAIYVYKPD